MQVQLLIDSVPALIHTALTDGYSISSSKPGSEYVGLSLEDIQGWKEQDFADERWSLW